jgi:site-specific DNA-cytosine methylase
MLDLFCGRFGWGRAFAERGWEVVGIDLIEPQEVPTRCDFVRADVLDIFYDGHHWAEAFCINGQPYQPEFICASSPCEQFSVHGMRHFHPNPSYPALGIKLFNHTRALCEASGVPYIMENVRPAQQFVGDAAHHCGPFYLWGTGVPPILPQGISKGIYIH